jgi:hypothetical protein
VDALRDTNGKQANTITEKVELLRQESFPSNEHDHYFKLPPAGQEHQSVNKQAVERALITLSIRNAPGPDKKSCKALHLRWEWEKMRLVELAKAVVRMGRCPAMWKQASGVVICKLGNDNMKLNVYRYISLLSRMEKVVEKVAAELLAGEAERRGLLSDSRNGSKKRRSAIDMVAIMHHRTHTALSDGQIAGILLMDIKAAFPTAGRGRLIHKMGRKGMDGDRIQWTASFLTDRTVEMVI